MDELIEIKKPREVLTLYTEINDELKQLHQWVCHKNKIPFQPNGYPAKTNDSSTWSSFDDCIKALEDPNNTTCTGIGFVFTKEDPYIGIDCDGCLKDDKLNPFVQKLVEYCESYTDESISGTGIHTIIKGRVPEGFSNNRSMTHQGFKALEVYGHGRYFTMTGKILSGKKQIREVDLTKFQYGGEDSSNHTNKVAAPTKSETLISTNTDWYVKKLTDGSEGQKFVAYFYRGDLSVVDGDQSRGDYELAKIIANEIGFQPGLIDMIFRASALMRPKWDQIHSSAKKTYGQMTIEKVLDTLRIKHIGWIENYLSYTYEFRFNDVLGKTQVKWNGKWVLLEDYQFNSIVRDLVNKGAKAPVQKIYGLLESDFVPRYHPFRSYFQSLSSWDGKDWIQKLANLVVTEDKAYWELCLRRWLVAMVASAIKDHIVNQTVLIFKGGQGLGKSTFIQGLVPNQLRDYFYSGNLNPNSKDSVIQLSESILCNLDELDSLSKYKESALKEMITKADIRIRRPYARYATKMVRHASLCGSVNHSAILHDPSGSRRYLIQSVKSIQYQHSIPIDKVYAQALHLFETGFKYWFEGEDIEMVNSQNRRYEVQTIEEELLLKHFKKASKNEQLAQKMRATELLSEIYRNKLPANAHSAKIRIGVALSKHQFEYTEANGSKYWWVVRKHFPTEVE